MIPRLLIPAKPWCTVIDVYREIDQFNRDHPRALSLRTEVADLHVETSVKVVGNLFTFWHELQRLKMDHACVLAYWAVAKQVRKA